MALREIGKALIGETVDEARLRRVLALTQAVPALRNRYNALIDTIERELTAWAADRLGVPASDLRPRLVAAAVLAARRVAMDTWLDAPGDDLAEHVTRAIDLLAAGLTDD